MRRGADVFAPVRPSLARVPFEDRFWLQVEKTPRGCWLWRGAVSNHGYGTIERAGRQVVASRASWEITYGEIPVGKFVLHRCDVPTCVRPDHLFIGTHEENMADMVRKGRARSGRVRR